MPSILRTVGRIARKRLQPREVGPHSLQHAARDVRPRFGEIIAVSMIPDFAGLPLEFWPGYRRHIAPDEPSEDRDSTAADQSEQLIRRAARRT
jgi:hypothetical protein